MVININMWVWLWICFGCCFCLKYMVCFWNVLRFMKLVFFFCYFEEGGWLDELIFIFILNIKINYIIGDDFDIDLYE